MLNKHYIAYGLAAAALIKDARVNHQNRKKFNSLQDDAIALFVELRRSQAQVDYLVNHIKEHGETPLDEFDWIILNDPA